jgi:phospholipase/carboxylesterase
MAYSYFFEPGHPHRPVLLLLHGTGGDEMQLVALARAACPGATLLALRGTVNENGKLRFFRRDTDGTLDEADMRAKAVETEAFVRSFLDEKDLQVPVVVGYSNGANLAAAQLWSGTPPFRAAILMRPVAPYSAPLAATLEGFPVMVLAGASDTAIDAGQTRRLVDELTHSGASIRHAVLDAGHDFGPADEDSIRDFLDSIR